LARVQVPQRIRPGHPEESWPPPPIRRAGGLQQPVGAHHPLHPLAVDRPTQLATGQCGDHPGAVGRVGLGDLDNRLVVGADGTGPSYGWSTLRTPIQRLAGDPSDARHYRWPVAGGNHSAGSGDAHAGSQSRESSPATSSS